MGLSLTGSCGIVTLVVGGIICSIIPPPFFAPTVAFRPETGKYRYHRPKWRDPGTFFRHHSRRRCPPWQEEAPCLDPWTTAIIDYSGANEYVKAHYGNHPLLQQSSSSWVKSSVPYFFREKSGGGGDKVQEPIYNGRELRILEERQSSSRTTTRTTTPTVSNTSSNIHRDLLHQYGMTLVDSPTQVMEWKNRTQIEDVYLQELETILPTLFSSKIDLCCFWNPMLRGEHHELSPPGQQRSRTDKEGQYECDDDDDDDVPAISTANVASAVHIDTDVGAYGSLEDFLAIVETNQVKKRRREQDATTPFDRKQYHREITKNKKRFAVVNFWRSTNRVAPVTNSPLAILSTRYEDRNTTSTADNTKTTSATKNENRSTQVNDFSAFPTARPDFEHSKWYTFPNMTSDEVLVFYQYDSLVTQPSDLWHCAISVEEGRAPDKEDAHAHTDVKRVQAPRESFDIRALLVFDETVQHDKDRFHPERVRPVLSFEESGCFCDEQAIKKRT